MENRNSFRVMTYNVGGGRKDFGTISGAVLESIKDLQPDILGIQEATVWIDADGKFHSMSANIAQAAGFGDHVYFGKTLSLQENMQVRKNIMLHGIYSDWQDWAQGNALLAKPGFSRLSDVGVPGTPRNIPLFRPAAYEGSRDTDPRFAIISRVSSPPTDPFVVNLHLTTLIGERGGAKKEIPGKAEQAREMRVEQAEHLIDLLAPKIAEKQTIILLGDFNAEAEEACIASVIQEKGGFTRLTPTKEISTHPKVEKAVDHIFVYPPENIAEYNCWIEENEKTQIASDHLPVVADITFK
jgi:endonuclease/exonuclease/phosphatase family metal-dependent hydrolase